MIKSPDLDELVWMVPNLWLFVSCLNSHQKTLNARESFHNQVTHLVDTHHHLCSHFRTIKMTHVKKWSWWQVEMMCVHKFSASPPFPAVYHQCWVHSQSIGETIPEHFLYLRRSLSSSSMGSSSRQSVIFVAIFRCEFSFIGLPQFC